MVSAVKHSRTLLGLIVVLQFIELSEALKEGDTGVCSDTVPRIKIVYEPILKKYKRCSSRGYSECSADDKKHAPPIDYKKMKCCVKEKKAVPERKAVCCNGYEYLDGKCVPYCDKECLGGVCVASNATNASNFCQCPPQFILVNETKCVPQPVCDPPCINGTCTANNTCACELGFENHNATHCTPKCDQACENGNCIAPNVCECNKGYTKKNGVCEPVCDLPCVNGTCLGPNVCKCNAGYEIDHKNKFECIPICTPNCVNASCDSPNTCSCLNGYETTGNNWICKPKCEDCEDGECAAPNVCVCFDGYSKSNGTCKPVCSKPCTNGFCAEPNACVCDHGYSLNREQMCVPDCEQECVNGDCISPNKCSCRPGYEMSKDENICNPKCDTCEFGKCVAPGTCQCNVGYKISEGKCLPVCAVPCVNGDCTAPNNCTCKEGYSKNSSSICIKPCNNPCDTGTPIVDCSTCEYNCTSDGCWCRNDTCAIKPMVEAEASTTTGLAGLELTWTLAGAIVLLLFVFVTVAMLQLYRRRKLVINKEIDDDVYGKSSIACTMPNTLIARRNEFDDDVRRTSDGPLLHTEQDYVEERL